MMIRDDETGDLRPYDPDLDYDKPLHLFGPLPLDIANTKATPLQPLKDLS
jgi:hypothetical protein